MSEKILKDVGLTFDDVTLVPRLSNFVPTAADVSTRFSRRINLKIPFASAAMDTVTESGLAIAIAQLGGIGVIHKNLSVQAQADEVSRVKRSESGMVVDPVTVRVGASLSEARTLMTEHNVSGLPVLDEDNRVVGILTLRDLGYEPKPGTVRDFMTTGDRLVTLNGDEGIDRARLVLEEHRIEKLPVLNSDGTLKGLITVKDMLKGTHFPKATRDGLGHLRVAAAVGPVGDFQHRAAALVSAGVDALVVETAHGHTEVTLSAVKWLKAEFPNVDIIAGNIATREAAMALSDAKVDAMKIGMGPGSICTTRVVSGAGVPQISAILACADIARIDGLPLIADGGIKYSGDATKALAAGADSVMIGSLFAGTDESPGDTINFQGRAFKAYRGMGSEAAMKRGSADRYGQDSNGKLVPEGIEGRVPSRGPLANMIVQLVGGVQSGMGYAGCPTIEALHEHAQFMRVTVAGLRESHVHDVVIEREPPNYTVSDR